MKSHILITAGGTGGHIYPAMALAKQLQEKNPSTNLMFIGGGLRDNRYFEKSAFPFQDVSCGSLSPLKPITSLRNIGRILHGIHQSRRLIKDFSPNLIIGFGSYHTLPTLLAAKLESVPIILHEANRIPGRVNKYLSRYVKLTGVHFPDTVEALKGPSVVASIPLRSGYKKNALPIQVALDYFQLHSGKITLLVFGGSQGADAINKLSSSAILRLSDVIKRELQVLHFTGNQRSEQQIREIYMQNGISAVVKDFESRMDLAWQIADLMISRSGAGTVAEELEYEVPGILIPYPHAMDNHQESNANFMVENVKGALMHRERDLDGDRLAKVISDLVKDDCLQLKTMRESMEIYKRDFKSKELSEIVIEMLEA